MTPRRSVLANSNVSSVVGRGGFIDVCPHDKDGWAVAHTSACGTRGAFLEFHFRLDDAIVAARLAAERLGAGFERDTADDQARADERTLELYDWRDDGADELGLLDLGGDE